MQLALSLIIGYFYPSGTRPPGRISRFSSNCVTATDGNCLDKYSGGRVSQWTIFLISGFKYDSSKQVPGVWDSYQCFIIDFIFYYENKVYACSHY
jgi:hypothetical protein